MPSKIRSEPTDAVSSATTDPLRVMIVDDSAFMRKMLSEILSAAPGIVVAGTARDGEDALAKLETLRPDVLTLDVEMPRMDGLTFLAALMLRRPSPPVVMISKLTAEGAEVTLACLQHGAVDFVLKPSGAISLNIAMVGEEIIAKVRAAARARAAPLRIGSLAQSTEQAADSASYRHTGVQ